MATSVAIEGAVGPSGSLQGSGDSRLNFIAMQLAWVIVLGAPRSLKRSGVVGGETSIAHSRSAGNMLKREWIAAISADDS